MKLNVMLLMVLFFSWSSGSAAAKETQVRIGVIAPLTGNGAHIGAEITRTLKLWARTRKAETGTAYSIIFEDGHAATDNSPTTAFRKLSGADGVRFLIIATSGEMLQAAPLAQAGGVLVFGVFASHAQIKKLGDYIFRTFPDVENGAAMLAGYMREQQDCPVALLTEDHPFNRGMKILLEQHLAGDLVFKEDYAFEERDLKPLLLRAKSKKPKAYYFNCSHPVTCALLVNQTRQLGIPERLYSYLHIDNPEFLQAAGQNAEGMRFLATPDVGDSSAGFKQFLAQYRWEYGHEPKNDFLTRTTYDAATAIADGINARGPYPEAVKSFLLSYKAQGALGKIGFNADGDIEEVKYAVKEIRGGKPVPAER